LQASHHEQALD
jgi:hypothetical protein